jgi:hypothetical protein
MSDFNGDGFVDAVDTDGDGYLDTYDTDADGYADTFDLNEDGFVDATDLDADGIADGTGFDAGFASAPFSGAADLDGDGLVDGNPNTFLDDDQYYSQAEQAVGYSASDTSFIEPADAAGSSSLISDYSDPGL